MGVAGGAAAGERAAAPREAMAALMLWAAQYVN